MTTKTYADGTPYQYTYDAGGRLLTRTDAKGVTTSYAASSPKCVSTQVSTAKLVTR